MEAEFLILVAVVFGAAALQSATGIGFGAIAGPVLLIQLNNGSAIQISVILNLLIAALLTPAIWKHVDKSLLKHMVAGLVLGSPLGLLIFLNIDIVLLKIGAGIAVLLTLLLVLSDARTNSAAAPGKPQRIGQAGIGAVAGIMGVCLAMPGPVPAAWMTASGYRKETIRATILAMFVVSYAIALVLQSALAGIEPEVLRQSALLIPATIMGIVLGHYLGRLISERGYRWIMATVLTITATVLFLSLG